MRQRRLTKDEQPAVLPADEESLAASSLLAEVRAAAKNILYLAKEIDDVDNGSFNRKESSFKRRSSKEEQSLKMREDVGVQSLSLAERPEPLPALTDRTIVGAFSCHGRDEIDKINQDCACIVHPVGEEPSSALFCVYDGHGKFGSQVSLQVLQSVHYELNGRHAPAVLRDYPPAALADAFEAVQKQLGAIACGDLAVDARDSGACALVVHVLGSTLTVANAGDCTCVMGRCLPTPSPMYHAVTLSMDHKPDLPAEKARIEGMGGWVRPAEVENGELMSPARLYETPGNRRRGPGLTISRSIGDLDAMRCGLLPTPAVTTHAVQPHDKFLILASDGIWEFISPQDAVDIVATVHVAGGRAFDACKQLITKAADAWAANEGDYRDDITAIVIWLPELLEALADVKHT